MDNKGLNYIDWIISFSLFLIIVMMIFAFLRPGISPAFDSEDLLNIIESNIVHESSWSVVSVPVAVKNLINNTVYVDVSHGLDSTWDFVDYYSTQNLTLLNMRVSLSFDTARITCKDNFPCKTGTSSSVFHSGIYLISVGFFNSSSSALNLSSKCSPNVPVSDCEYIIGSKEIFTGLNEDNLLLLASEDYDIKKNDWNFPDSRDFSVSLDYLNGTIQDLIKPNYPVPDRLSVFVKEISMPILNENATRTPAKLGIKVW